MKHVYSSVYCWSGWFWLPVLLQSAAELSVSRQFPVGHPRQQRPSSTKQIAALPADMAQQQLPDSGSQWRPFASGDDPH